MGIKLVAVLFALLGGASAFQAALPRPARATALHAHVGDRRAALGAGFAALTGAAAFATPAFALRSVSYYLTKYLITVDDGTANAHRRALRTLASLPVAPLALCDTRDTRGAVCYNPNAGALRRRRRDDPAQSSSGRGAVQKQGVFQRRRSGGATKTRRRAAQSQPENEVPGEIISSDDHVASGFAVRGDRKCGWQSLF